MTTNPLYDARLDSAVVRRVALSPPVRRRNGDAPLPSTARPEGVAPATAGATAATVVVAIPQRTVPRAHSTARGAVDDATHLDDRFMYAGGWRLKVSARSASTLSRLSE